MEVSTLPPFFEFDSVIPYSYCCCDVSGKIASPIQPELVLEIDTAPSRAPQNSHPRLYPCSYPTYN